MNNCLDGIQFKRKSFYLKLDMTVTMERTETRLYYLFYFSFQLEVSKKKYIKQLYILFVRNTYSKIEKKV